MTCRRLGRARPRWRARRRTPQARRAGPKDRLFLFVSENSDLGGAVVVVAGAVVVVSVVAANGQDGGGNEEHAEKDKNHLHLLI